MINSWCSCHIFIPPPYVSKNHLVHFRTFPISKTCFNVVPYTPTETGSWYPVIPNRKGSFGKSAEIYFLIILIYFSAFAVLDPHLILLSLIKKSYFIPKLPLQFTRCSTSPRPPVSWLMRAQQHGSKSGCVRQAAPRAAFDPWLLIWLLVVWVKVESSELW